MARVNKFVIELILYFIIHKLLGFSEMRSKVLPRMCIYTTAANQHLMHRNIFSTFYSFSIILFFENSSSKASGLPFIFVCVSTGHAHFSTNEIHISCEPRQGNLGVFQL